MKQMALGLALAAGLAVSVGHAQDTGLVEVCKGTLDIYLYQGKPGDVVSMKRDAVVSFTMSTPTAGTMKIDIGGDPITYTGTILLNGQPNSVKVTAPGSGDKAVLNFQQHGRNMNYSAKFYNVQNAEVGGIRPGVMTCN